MTQFDSLEDWPKIDTEIRRGLWSLHNLTNKRQLETVYRNLESSVNELSKLNVERRRLGKSTHYDEQLIKVQEELQNLQGLLIFATLLDEKPKE
jgi:hypothetical protein